MKDQGRIHLYLIIFLLSLFLAILVWNKPLEKAGDYYNKRTDSLTSTKAYEIPQIPPQSIIIKPNIVISYPKTPTPQVHLELGGDSLILVIDSLQKVITEINSDYIEQYPTASKLIYLDLTQDSLKLDLLDTNGKINSNRYRLYLSKLGYTFREGEISGYERRSTLSVLPITRFHSHIYPYVGYCLLPYKNPTIGIQYQIALNKLSVETESFLGISSNPTLNLQLKFKYQLK